MTLVIQKPNSTEIEKSRPGFEIFFKTTTTPFPSNEITEAPNKESINSNLPEIFNTLFPELPIITTAPPKEKENSINKEKEEEEGETSILKSLGKLLPELVTGGNVDTVHPIIPNSIIKISKPGEFCDDEMVFCSNGSLCIRNQFTPGMSCKEEEECDGGSICLDEICTCPINKPSIVDGMCVPESSTPNPKPPQHRNRREISYDSTTTKKFRKPPKFDENSDNISSKASLSNSLNEKIGTQSRNLKSRKIVYQQPETNNINDVIPLGANCDLTDNNCPYGAECVQSICQCSTDFVQAGPLCVLKNKIANNIILPGIACSQGDFCDGGSVCRINPGQTCSVINICLGGSTCQNGVCVCPSGQQSNNGTCGSAADPTIQYSQPGESCLREPNTVVVIECTGNSICANGFCTCPNGERIVNGICFPLNSRAAPGEPCVEGTTNCTGNSYCLNGFCVCRSQQSFYNGQCRVVNSGTAYPYDPCNGATTQCVGNSYCNNNLCQCNTGLTYDPNSRQCINNGYGTAYPYDPCSSGTQCVGNSYCNNNQCQCNTGYIYDPNTRQCNNGYGTANPYDPCDGVRQCTGNSYCNNNQCQCNTGLTYDPNTRQCITSGYGNNQLEPGAYCGSSYTVCVQNAECVNQMCACQTGYVVYDNNCIPYSGNANPGDSCQQPGIVCIGGASCTEGICACANGFTPSGSNCIPYNPAPQYPLRLIPGETCDSRCAFSNNCQQSCTGGSLCVDNICTCPIGQYVINGNCIPQLPPQPTYIPTVSNF
uniref:EGF-like domain-containing protein n=1 Tax=Panagrolaimus davidi TaxID=227884 RepID=A0A914R087_9BILA